MATGNDLYGGQLAEFKRRIKQIDASAEQIGKTPETKKEEKVLGHTAEVLAGKIQEQQDNNAESEQTASENKEDEKITSSAENQAEKEEVKAESEVEQVVKEVKKEKIEDNKTPEVPQTSNEKEEKVEVEQPTYKGKIIYPPRRAAEKLRQSKLSANSKASNKVKVPARKPKYARK